MIRIVTIQLMEFVKSVLKDIISTKMEYVLKLVLSVEHQTIMEIV
jgi:hypothetical protein